MSLYIPNFFPHQKISFCGLIISLLLLITEYSFSQCSILTDAVQGISYTYVQGSGTNASGVAYNPNFNLYYAVIAGNSAFPYETFDPTGVSLYQTNAGFDFRGLWWNPNTNQVEGNGYFDNGLWTSDLDVNGYAQNTGTNLFTGQNQPDAQSCGDYDYDADEIIYFFNGSIYRYDRSTDAFISSYPLTGLPVPLSDINSTSVIYTGCCGNEIGLEDYVNKSILLFSKSTGAYSGSSQLPSSAPTNSQYRFSYANNLVWLYDANARVWTSYSIISGSSGNNYVNLGNDTALCIGSTLTLSAGNSADSYLWSTGSTDSVITIDTAGIYWLTVTLGSCIASDTIEISDTLCAPLIAFAASNTGVCQKFCIDFFDSSLNNPTAWLWSFPGGTPSSSTDKNPMNICYNDSGTYDVTLITTSATGNDTLTLTDYIKVYATPPFPTITQNGYVLTSSPGAAYQWQLNSTDIPGATNQSYTVLQTGFYAVIVYDEHGCKNIASQYVQVVGINEINEGLNFSMLPNPNNGKFVIELSNFPDKYFSLSVMNALGQLIFSSEETNSSEKFMKDIDLGNTSSGIYFIEIKSYSKNSLMKFIVSK